MDRQTLKLVKLIDLLERKVANLNYITSIATDGDNLVITYSDDSTKTTKLSSVDISNISTQVISEVNSHLSKEGERLQQELQKVISDKIASISISPAKDGRDGKDADEEAITKRITDALRKSIDEHVRDIKDKLPTPRDGRDGKDADEEGIKASVEAKLASSVEEMIKRGVETIKASIPDVKNGVDGRDGRDADEDKILGVLKRILSQDIEDYKIRIKHELRKELDGIKLSIPESVNGRDADEDKIITHLSKVINEKINIHVAKMDRNINDLLVEHFKTVTSSIAQDVYQKINNDRIKELKKVKSILFDL